MTRLEKNEEGYGGNDVINSFVGDTVNASIYDN